MYLIILPIFMLFIGAEDPVKDMEDQLAEIQISIDTLTPKVNEMNDKVEQKKEIHDKWENDYRAYSSQLNSMSRDDGEYSSIQYLRDDAKSEWLPLRGELKTMMSIQKSLQDRLDVLILEQDLLQKNLDNLLKSIKPTEPKKFISISISQVCENMIKQNITTNCPKYEVLKNLFDNTNYNISGDFIEKDNDLRRDGKQMIKHWQFYPNNGYETLVMVDPDVLFMKQAVNIEVQSSDFRVANIWGGQSKQSSFVNGTIISYNGFSVDNGCTQINTAPDLELITKAIGFAMSGCVEEFDIKPTVEIVSQLDYENYTSKETQYQDWLSNVVENLQLDSKVKEKIEDLTSMPYPNWFNNNIDWVKSEKISNTEFINAFEMLEKEGIIA